MEAPLQRIEHKLHPFTAFVIMPVFAFSNSGVQIEFSRIAELYLQPVSLGVIFGLVAGKQLGIMGACWLAVKSGLADLPQGVRWLQLWGVTWLAGIGFTMSLFIAGLAFPLGHDSGHGPADSSAHGGSGRRIIRNAVDAVHKPAVEGDQVVVAWCDTV